MAPAVTRYFEEGLAALTSKTYDAAMKFFYAFALSSILIYTPFPVTEHTLCSFAAHIADQGQAPQTIKSYLSAICNTQISLGSPLLLKRPIILSIAEEGSSQDSACKSKVRITISPAPTNHDSCNELNQDAAGPLRS